MGMDLELIYNGFEWLMSFVSLFGAFGLISWFFTFIIPEGYKKKDFLGSILVCVLLFAIGGLISHFRFFQFVSQCLIIL